LAFRAWNSGDLPERTRQVHCWSIDNFGRVRITGSFYVKKTLRADLDEYIDIQFGYRNRRSRRDLAIAVFLPDLINKSRATEPMERVHPCGILFGGKGKTRWAKWVQLRGKFRSRPAPGITSSGSRGRSNARTTEIVDSSNSFVIREPPHLGARTITRTRMHIARSMATLPSTGLTRNAY